MPDNREYQHFASSKHKDTFIEVLLKLASYVHQSKNNIFSHDLSVTEKNEISRFDQTEKLIWLGPDGNKSLPAGAITITNKSGEDGLRVQVQDPIRRRALYNVR